MVKARAARAPRSAKQTFLVTCYGPSGAGKTATVHALHARLPPASTSAVSQISDAMPGGSATTRFFDYRPPVDRGLQATLRIRAVTGTAVAGQAFLSLIHCDAIVLLFDARRARLDANTEAAQAARKHAETYNMEWARFPIVIQLTHLDGPDPVPIAEVRRLLAAPGAPCVDTNPRTGAGIEDLARAVERQVIDAFHDGRAVGRRTTTPSRQYLERAEALGAAADIAIATRAGEPWSLELATKQMALCPELGYATLSSLASLETSFFTYWNEASGPDVEAFWREVARRGLPFHRRDVAAEALARGRITNRGDYETVTDLMGEDRFSADEKKRLSAMLGAYEAAAVRPRGR